MNFFSARLFFLDDFLFPVRLFLAPLFFFGTTGFFFGTTFFCHDFLFSARPGQVTADQYYYSGMEHMVIVLSFLKFFSFLNEH